jgi:hypothetical protein
MQEPIRYIELLLPDREPFSNYSFQDPNELNANNKIAELSLVNIFIGINNSGKSRLLRALFSLKCDEILYNTNRYSAKDYFDLVESLEAEQKEYTHELKVSKMDFSFLDILQHKNEFLSVNINYESLEKKLWKIRNCQEATKQENKTTDDQDILLSLANLGQKYLDKFENISIVPSLGNEKQYYIPILRGMRPLDEQQTDFYQHKTQVQFENIVWYEQIFQSLP